MNARCPKGPAASSCRYFPPLEVTEEFVPFLVGGDTVFFGGSQCPPSGEKGQVGLDGLLGVNGFVAHRDVDVAITRDHLSDVRRQSVHHGIGDKHSAKIVGRVAQRAASHRVNQTRMGQGLAKHPPDQPDADCAIFSVYSALE